MSTLKHLLKDRLFYVEVAFAVFFFYSLPDANEPYHMALGSTVSLFALLMLLRRKPIDRSHSVVRVMLAALCVLWFGVPLIHIFMMELGGPYDPDSYFMNLVKFLSQSIIFFILLIPFLSSYRTMNKLQLLIDSAVSLCCVTFLAYFVVSYDQQASFLSGYSLAFTLFTSIVITANCVWSCIIVLSTRMRSLAASFLSTMLGFGVIFMFYLLAVIDIRERGPQFARVSFTPYFVMMILIGFGALIDRYRMPEPIQQELFPQNYQMSYRALPLMILPLVMLYSGLIYLTHFIIILLLVVFQQLASYQIQKTVRTGIQAGMEKQTAEKLEMLVQERTAELERLNRDLVTATITDPMTGLNNRKHFLDHVQDFENRGVPFVLFYMDLDHFKVINDVHGHDTGDAVIKRIARRLSQQLPSDCYPARVGDDEFAVVVPSSGKGIDASREVRISQLIADAVSDRIYIDEFAFDVGVSIGVANYPADASNSDTVMKFATLAMIEAKKGSGNRKILFYNRNYGIRIERDNKIEYLLKNIDFDEQLQLYFQPQYDVEKDKVIGLEALVRWNSPELGVIPPSEFIPIAEQTGSIIKVGKWVIERAFRQAKLWNENSLTIMRVGINLSPLQFDSVELLPYIRMQVLRLGINPKWIEFEVTENVNLKEGGVIQEVFRELRELGFHIAIDDFGTGYSSLSYIKNFRIHRIKIAKELVDHIAESQEERVIIQAIISIAQGMNIEVLAEGCETKKQCDILLRSGCSKIQGFFFSEPVDAETINARFLKTV